MPSLCVTGRGRGSTGRRLSSTSWGGSPPLACSPGRAQGCSEFGDGDGRVQCRHAVRPGKTPKQLLSPCWLHRRVELPLSHIGAAWCSSASRQQWHWSSLKRTQTASPRWSPQLGSVAQRQECKSPRASGRWQLLCDGWLRPVPGAVCTRVFILPQRCGWWCREQRGQPGGRRWAGATCSSGKWPGRHSCSHSAGGPAQHAGAAEPRSARQAACT